MADRKVDEILHLPVAAPTATAGKRSATVDAFCARGQRFALGAAG